MNTEQPSSPLKIMPVEQTGAVGKCQGHPSSYERFVTIGYTKPTKKLVAQYALQQLEAARAQDVATHEANGPAIANNLAVRAAVEQLMDSIGMPKKYSERDRTSRSRFPKTITHQAGYLTDLVREVKADDGFATATSTYNSLKAGYEAYAAEGEREVERAKEAAARAEAEKIAKRKADMALAAILLRYSLPPENDWGDVLEHLRGKDQRLDLAVAMKQTRGDWSDGAHLVSAALQRFTIRNDEDKDIANDVLGCTHDFEDGRVFRDTDWSYDRLFAKVAEENEQLVHDILQAYANLVTA